MPWKSKYYLHQARTRINWRNCLNPSDNFLSLVFAHSVALLKADQWPVFSLITDAVLSHPCYHLGGTPTKEELSDTIEMWTHCHRDMTKGNKHHGDDGMCLKPMTEMYSVDKGDGCSRILHVFPLTNQAHNLPTFFPSNGNVPSITNTCHFC